MLIFNFDALLFLGTMSLNEIAVDLTCEPEDFEPATTSTSEDEETPVPGQFTFPSTPIHLPREASSPRYHVHSGMLRMARAMGDVGKPVQLAVHEALYNNPDYGERLVAFPCFYYPLILANNQSFRTCIMWT
jgi:hypothetical protein